MIVKEKLRLYWLQLILNFITIGFLALIYVSFYRSHITLAELILAEGLSAAVVAGYIALRGRFKMPSDLMLGLAILGASTVLLILPFSRTVFYFYSILKMVGIITFYVPYNILYFKKPLEGKFLQDMTWYWGMMLIPSIIGPLVGALILVKLDVSSFVLIGLAILTASIFIARKVPAEKFDYSTAGVLKHLAGARLIVVLDGALHKVMQIIFIVALLYIPNETDYGNFLAIVSLVAFFAAILLAKRSDKNNRRMLYLWPLCLIAGAITIWFGWTKTFGVFLILAMTLKAVTVLVEPLRANIMQDTFTPASINWIAREFYLNVGRAALYLVCFVLMAYNLMSGIFLFLGLLHIIFPILVHFKKTYR